MTHSSEMIFCIFFRQQAEAQRNYLWSKKRYIFKSGCLIQICQNTTKKAVTR